MAAGKPLICEDTTIALHDDHDLQEDEGPDAGDWTSDDASVDEIVCPACRQPVYEEANKCPTCGEWLTTPSHSPSRIVLFVTVLLIILVISWAII